MIDPVPTSQTYGPNSVGQGQGGDVMQQVLSAAATVLNMSTSDVTSALRSGQSLAALAQQQGVSPTDLTTAVTQALQTAGQNGATLPQDPSTMAQQIVNQKGFGHHHHHRHGSDGSVGSDGNSPSSADQLLTSISSALDMQPQDVLQSLLSGTSLQSLAQQQGVSESTLSSLVGSQGLAIDTTA
jgi:lambda repressor-like predicted transcriptional regulator